MESFAGTTDGSGDLTCSVTTAPRDKNRIIPYTNNGAYLVKVSSISGTTVKIRFYTIQYLKAISTVKEVDNLPTNVVQATSKTTSEGGGVIYSCPDGAPASNTNDHSHGISFQYLHTHNIPNFTTTDSTSGAVTSTSVNCNLLYGAVE